MMSSQSRSVSVLCWAAVVAASLAAACGDAPQNNAEQAVVNKASPGGKPAPAPSEAARPVGTAAAAEAVAISKARVRLMPPGSPVTGAFFSMTSGAKEPAVLVSAASPVAETVELHTHVQEDGQFKMRQVDHIAVLPGETTELKPGGLHVMLIGLKADLTEGETVPLTLTFAGGHTRELAVPVQAVQPAAHGKGGGHHGGH